MNREQRRKASKATGRKEMQSAYFDNAKKTNKAYSECADEILEIYNQWINVSFDSEKEFLDIINQNDISVEYKENSLCVMCSIVTVKNESNVGEIFVSHSVNTEDKMRFKTDLALLLFHVISLCENENNKRVIRQKIGELL